MRRLLVITLLPLMTGCISGHIDFAPPPTPTVENSIVIHAPEAVVWDAVIPEIAKSYFTINNIERDSGLINLSYSGQPELYVDGGTVTSVITGVFAGARYSFGGTDSTATFRAFINGQVVDVQRSVILEGKANMILENESPVSCKLTITVHYVLVAHDQWLETYYSYPNVLTRPMSAASTASFTSKSTGVFQPSGRGHTVSATGKFERDFLDLVRKALANHNIKQ
jgi:hypothetical protein